MASQAAYKLTLKSGKTVTVREFKIKHTEQAAELAGARAGTNPALLQVLVQKEIVKLLIVEVNGKALTGAEKEDLDSVFTTREYGEVVKGIDEITEGGEKLGKPQIEPVISGDK